MSMGALRTRVRNTRTMLAAGGLSLLAACATTGNHPASAPATIPAVTTPATPEATSEAKTADLFRHLRADPVRLAMFLRRMPKGADLHNHLTGGIYAENMVDWAAAKGACVDPKALVLKPAPCAKDLIPATDARRDVGLYNRLINALSMRGFVAGPETGHDHFFDSFAKFEPAVNAQVPEMLAEAANRAAASHVLYLELMWSNGMSKAAALAKPLGNPPPGSIPGDTATFDAWRTAIEPGLPAVIAAAKADTDAAEARMRQILRCGTAEAQPGCGVQVRYLAQVIRVLPGPQVFSQSLYGYALTAADPRFVGVNLVAPEDNPVTLKDYGLQMRLLGYLGHRMPAANLSLHAGELALGLVPPEDLRDHIRLAVEVAGAKRIGHGVDIGQETDAQQVLKTMADRDVLVEINLTSNDVILGVTGRDHPITTYRAFGVPLALSTDDEGVSRIDLTHEYVRAAETYGLDYATLKTFSRNGLEHAFLPGASLWAAPGRVAARCAADHPGTTPSAACQAFLDQSPKAALQWRLEANFHDFEAAVAAEAESGLWGQGQGPKTTAASLGLSPT
ncbi:adenosine deaminase [Nitrospirillum sp. BR 11752]|uniref:adenosine deaminase family protein n=1 Tax=Nitrospirillum sp. BR 11752 TaxID=3104293 RepID=UPI002EAFA39D|nr:adenosine deaminase [Nitrospirillum sp. BR 11752]